MKNVIKARLEYLIISIWGIYTIYLALFGGLLLFPKDSLELIVPVTLQLAIFKALKKLYKEKYVDTISLTALADCILVILWHYNLNHSVPRKPVVMAFLALPVFSSAITYFMGKVKKVVPLLIWKNFGVSLLLTFSNLIIAVFTFYIFHYWL